MSRRGGVTEVNYMKIKLNFKKIISFLGLLSLAVGVFFGVYGAVIPGTVSCFSGVDAPAYLGATLDSDAPVSNDIVSLSSGQYKLFGTLPVRSVTVARLKDIKVYVGGVPFGLKFSTSGATVVGFEDEGTNPAYRAGLRLYDMVIGINGTSVSSVSDIARAARSSGEIELTYLRAGKEGRIKFSPKYSSAEGGYTLGLYLKDSGAGIGTLTYVLPDGTFGGLGHGIIEQGTGELTRIVGGQVLGVTVNGIVKGQRGTPGELKGYFNSSKTGVLIKNTDCGVFGTLMAIPDSIKGELYSIGLRGELCEGEATVLCTLDDNVRREYSISISDINRGATGNKCFTVKITDERLCSATGGIVQGMSGSPIIQNGKLVGAITHVLVNDPTSGYGVFVENMLAAMSDSTGSEKVAA